MRRLLWTILGLISFCLAAGCTPDLGDAPFLCNAGSPKCPAGYTCNESSNICVPDGACPEGVPGCEESDASPLPSCGNATCEPAEGEDCMTCEDDCGPCVGCGDGTCDFKTGETCKSCVDDCGACECGNDRCDVGEDENNCPEDCAEGPRCGNGACEQGETESNCPLDCAVSKCGNGQCDAGETEITCPDDCKTETCGNGQCDVGENNSSCPQDCPPQPLCGDGRCESPETAQSCPQDCQTSDCGNGTCEPGETTSSCPQDCGSPCPVNDATRCLNTSSIEYCDQGTWVTFDCVDVCAPGTSRGCGYSADSQRDVCSCDMAVANYGEACGTAIVTTCQSDQMCVVFDTDVIGFCTQTCTGLTTDCAGDPPGTYSECSDATVGSDTICLFYCDMLTLCPTDLYCTDAILGGVCIPRQ